MDKFSKFYIGGKWVDPLRPRFMDVIDPSTEQPFAKIALGSAEDVDRAVEAARSAFPSFASTSVGERVAILERAYAIFKRRQAELAEIITKEVGSPITFSTEAQTHICKGHFEATIEALRTMEWDEQIGSTLVAREPIGVVGLITPWNWPVNQVVCKVLPALAVGCTIVLKPSEIAPLDATIFAEILEEAGVPPGVFNLVNGEGAVVGEAISRHPGIDTVSFTGSTRAGILVAKAAADTVKRVTQELGGKSANIILDDADFEKAVRDGTLFCFANSGQSCDAPTRMLVPKARLDEAIAIAKTAAESLNIGDPNDPGTTLGPVISEVQFTKIQELIGKGIAEGATLVTGGLGRPNGLNRGYYVKPTVFAGVDNNMTIAREEIFGPVLCILSYATEDQAIEIANDTPYGLAAYVEASDLSRARAVARRIRAGSVFINYPDWDAKAPFGGYKQSGNGRESGYHGMIEYLELKSIIGHG